MTAVWKTPMASAALKLVALSLADQANDAGVCWPSMRHIARRCDLSERSVADQVRLLRESGFLQVQSGGGTASNRYTVTVPTPAPLAGAPLHQLHGTPAPLAGAPLHQLHANPKGEPSLKPKKKAPLAQDYPLPAELDTPEMQEAWKDWQQHRREKRQPITPTAAGKQLALLCGIGIPRALAALRHSTASGYQGIFEPKGGHTPPQAQPKAPVPFVAGVENFDGTPWTDPTTT